MLNYQTHRHFLCCLSTVMLYIDNSILQRFHYIIQRLIIHSTNIQQGFKVINLIVCLVSYSFQLISEVLYLMCQITCILFGIFRQPFVDSSFLGSCLSISLQLFFKLLGIVSPLFHHPPNLVCKRMLVEDGFGMLPIQLLLLIKGSGIMFIIDGKDGFRCCSL